MGTIWAVKYAVEDVTFSVDSFTFILIVYFASLPFELEGFVPLVAV